MGNIKDWVWYCFKAYTTGIVIGIVIILALFGISYVWGQVTSLTELNAPLAADDWVMVVDRSDTTMSPNGTNKKVQPYRLRRWSVVHKTANYNVLSTDCGKLIDNYGATAARTFTLPECVASPSGTGQVTTGWNVRFMVIAAYAIYVDPYANDSIFDFSNGEAGEYIYSDTTPGTALTIACMREASSGSGSETDGYNMVSVGYVGTWTTQD